VKQRQAEGAERIVDMIFENSKLRSGSPQLEVVCEKNIKPSVQNGGVTVIEQNAVKVDERSKDEVEEFYTTAVQTRAQKQAEFKWKGPALITERRGLVNYRVRFESGEEKTFHINMLKKYNEREDSVEAPANMPVL